MVKAVGRFFKHLSALVYLSKDNEPGLSFIRGAAILEVFLIFGDASDLGFGLLWTEGVSVGCRF